MTPRSLLGRWLMASSLAGWLMAGALAGALVGSGCASSPEPQFYTLYPRAGRALADAPLQVELRRPGLPGYLDRPQIVRHERPGQLEFSGDDRWGAPLDAMIGSILVQDLAQRLPAASVFSEAGAISSSPDALVEVDIQRFELTERGSIDLVAQVAVHWPRADAPSRLERYTLSRNPSDRSTARMVSEMSALLAELASSIARTLGAGPSRS